MPAAGKVLAVIFLVSMMPSVSVQQLDCGPGAEAVEKTQHTLTCEGLQADGTVYWSKHDRNLGEITIASCDATGFCQTNFSTRYDVKRPNNVTSTLKILDVKRDETFVEGEWSCFSNSTEYGSCYVTVVFLPHMAECEVGFDEQSGLVTGRCEMYKVYPAPTCNWYEHLQGQVTDIPRNQTSLTLTQYVDTSSSQIYFRGTCRLHRLLPVTAGRYVYKALILPGLVEPPMAFTTTDIVALPARPVLTNCSQDYVTNADNNSCTCVTSYLGSPRGSLAWFDLDNKIVVRNTSLILVLPFSRVTAEFSEPTYKCSVVHHTGSLTVEYVPKLSASPNKPQLSGIDTNKVYDVGATINLKCSANGGRPAITWVILECVGRPDEEDSRVNGSVISQLSFVLKESDNNGECVCYATNGVLTSEKVTQRINDRVTSGKGYELEVWHVALPVAVVAAVVLVSVVACAIRKGMCCRSKQDDSGGLLSDSQRGSTTTLNTDGGHHPEMGRARPYSPKGEATGGQYSQLTEGCREEHVYSRIGDSNSQANSKKTLATSQSSQNQGEPTTPLANPPPPIVLSEHLRYPQEKERYNQNNQKQKTEQTNSKINSSSLSDTTHRDDQAYKNQDRINGTTIAEGQPLVFESETEGQTNTTENSSTDDIKQKESTAENTQDKTTQMTQTPNESKTHEDSFSTDQQADLNQADSAQSAPKQTGQPSDNKRHDSTAKRWEDAVQPDAKDLGAPETSSLHASTPQALAGHSSTELHNQELIDSPDKNSVQSGDQMGNHPGPNDGASPKANSQQQPPSLVPPAPAPGKHTQGTDRTDDNVKPEDSPSEADIEVTARPSIQEMDVQSEKL